jgi:hypothetical protein
MIGEVGRRSMRAYLLPGPLHRQVPSTGTRCAPGFSERFEVSFSYLDRTDGTEESTVKLQASNLPGAVAKATRQFVKGLDRKQRFDLNKNGLEIKAVLVATENQSGSVADNPPSAGA